MHSFIVVARQRVRENSFYDPRYMKKLNRILQTDVQNSNYYKIKKKFNILNIHRIIYSRRRKKGGN